MPRLEAREISAKLISFDNWKADVARAWSASRPGLDEAGIDPLEVVQLDVPVAEFGAIQVELDCPILFREILAMDRTHVMWARTSRVDDLRNVWPICSHVGDDEKAEIATLAGFLGRSKEAQDQYRLNIPLGYMTGLSMRFSPRSLVRAIKTFQNISFEHSHVSKAAIDMANTLSDIGLQIGLPIVEMLKGVSPILLPTPSDKIKDIGEAKVDCFESHGHAVLVLRAAIALRAQLVRHRAITIVDQLPELLSYPAVWSLPIRTRILIEVAAPKDVWKGLAAKRNCWIAQADIWSPVLAAVNQMAETVELPCKNGSCPFALDNIARLQGKDPNPPCPRQINLDKVRVGSARDRVKLATSITNYAGETGRTDPLWLDEILRLTNGSDPALH